MPSIEVSDELIRKLRAFDKIMKVVLTEENLPKTENERAEFVLSIGLVRMLQDLLPKEEVVHLKAMAELFDRNPELICDYVAEKIEKGKEEELRKRWIRDTE